MPATTELQQLTRALESLRISDVAVAGGKGANLGELIGAGFPVPPGFVVTAQAFLDAMEDAGARERLAASVRSAVTASPSELETLARGSGWVRWSYQVPSSPTRIVSTAQAGECATSASAAN